MTTGAQQSRMGFVLAGGKSSRMGTDKALLPWPPAVTGRVSEGTFLSAAIRSFSLSADFVIVVAGKNENLLAPVCYAEGASIVVNPWKPMSLTQSKPGASATSSP